MISCMGHHFKQVLIVMLLAFSAAGSAQEGGTAHPVLVIFNDNASLAVYGENYHPDDRALANPSAWKYLDTGVAGTVQMLERAHGFRANHVYSASVRGFSARLTVRQIEDLQNDTRVAYVEADGIVSAIGQTIPWGIDRVDADLSSTRAGDGQGAISNVHVYVVDTGVDARHLDLQVINHVNFARGKNADCHGHGTHVAGTIAAKDNALDVVGVAPGAPVTGVKVLDCNGSGFVSDVVKGIDWVTANAIKPAIANLSLSAGANQSLDDAVIRSADSGVFYSVAAGNSGANACNYSPSRAGTHEGVLTTAAIDSSDREASFSNYGPCVDLWAPGVGVLSTKLGGGTTTFSGTSMAAPHSGGVAASYLSLVTSATPAAVEASMKSNAKTVDPGSTGHGGKTTSGKTSKDGRTMQIVNASTY